MDEAEIRTLMWKCVALFRDAARLRDAVSALHEQEAALDDQLASRPVDHEGWRRASIVTVAALIAKAALRREESRGGHFRTDFPSHDDLKWKIHVSDVRRLRHSMRQSKLLLQTYREAPRDADVVSQQLMMRAGMIQKVAAGIYDYLPLALRSIRKFENIVREELDARRMPGTADADGAAARAVAGERPLAVLRPGAAATSRIARAQTSASARRTRRSSPTSSARTCKSYKQLPINLFQIQTKFRDEIRPRFGLMRGREFIMKDAYSFHVDDADADSEYWRMFEAYKRIFTRLGVKFRPVEADSGAIGGSFTHEFHVLAGSGEDAILSCTRCEYTSNAEKTEAPALAVSRMRRSRCCDLKRAHFHTPGHRRRWRSRRRPSRTPITTACRSITRRSSICTARRRATRRGTSAWCCAAITSRTPSS